MLMLNHLLPYTIKNRPSLLFIYIFCVFFLPNCSTIKPLTNNNNLIDIQGHRGCRGLMPENTIAGFIKALELGVTTVELDVVITKDNEVLVSHEPFFNHEISTKPNGNRVTKEEEKSLNIYNMTYVETQQYDVGLAPHPRFKEQQKIPATKPLLADVIDAVEAYIKQHQLPLVQYNIETKLKPATDNIYHPTPAAFIELIMKVLNNKGISERTIIQSFDTRTLQYLHTHYPNIKTAYLYEEVLGKSLSTRLTELGFTPTIYSPYYKLVNKKTIHYCRALGIKVIPWTVNTLQEINKLLQLGVDGIITDYPNLISGTK